MHGIPDVLSCGLARPQNQALASVLKTEHTQLATDRPPLLIVTTVNSVLLPEGIIPYVMTYIAAAEYVNKLQPRCKTDTLQFHGM